MGATDEDPVPHPQVSVVLPVLNGIPWLELQLEALSTQELPCAWEVVVADNGSRDGTRSCVESWTARNPRFRWVDASTRSGAGAARNIGVRAAGGQILVFCDADELVRPAWLAAMVGALTDAEVVAGVFDFGSLNGHPASNPVPAATHQMGFLPFALGANMAVHRDAFEAVHGFCETLPAGEDIDLSWRLQVAGFRFAVCGDAVVAKRERREGTAVFRATLVYGQSALLLFRRFETYGMKRDLRGAVKTWAWLLAAIPGLLAPGVRRRWLRSFGIRAGRLIGSAKHRVFFP
jgi:glycosyltransferase involved in cell wall biosynthesis